MSINPQLTAAMLERDLEAAQCLRVLLEEERQLLEQRDHQSLSKLIEQKNIHIGVLNHHANERQSVLESLNMTSGNRDWEKLLASDPALRAHLPLWQTVKDTVLECQRLNDVNGRLINRSQQTLVRLLNLVRGKTAAPQLYNAAGASTHTPSSQTLTRA